jgi:tRNA A37 N6-isopentenylltransferase MiaA
MNADTYFSHRRCHSVTSNTKHLLDKDIHQRVSLMMMIGVIHIIKNEVDQRREKNQQKMKINNRVVGKQTKPHNKKRNTLGGTVDRCTA